MDPLMNPTSWPPPPSFPQPPPPFSQPPPPPQSFSQPPQFPQQPSYPPPQMFPPPPQMYPPPPPPQQLPSFPAVNNNHTQPQPQSQIAEPPYPDMIIGAIAALKEREGSSRQAIAKYIQNVYTGNLPSNHPTLLTYHLKRMKNEGSLTMVKHSYALPGSIPIPDPTPIPGPVQPLPDSVSPTPTTGPKRGRGRPPKSKTAEPVQPGEAQPVQQAQPNAETMLVSLGLVDGPAAASPGVKRGRGRPKKVPGVRPRGRPARLVRAAGRPPRVADMQFAAVSVPERRGRPKKALGGKPRGRPRKFPVVGVAGVGGGVSGVPVAMKRRGRPPGAVGKAKQPWVYSGKPRGRPRKDVSAVPATQVAAQHLAAYQDLKNKLEHFQSRVNHAVNLVRPYFTSEATPYVYGALQELDELANMDMTAPPQPPPQAEPPVQVAPPQAQPEQPLLTQS